MQERPLAAALSQLLRPITIAALVAGVATLSYWQLKAPGRPDVPTLAAPVATQFPTTTPGPSPTFGPPPTPGPPTPTATPDVGAPGRDARRKRDLALIAEALDRYFADEGTFPKTGPNLQSLCTYKDLDAGCKLAPYMDGGVPGDNRVPYRYASDGRTWTIFAEFEAITPADRCSDARAEQLPNADDIFCVAGGPPGDSSP